MSTGSHLVDGDGPPVVDDFEATCKESPWANLPVPVFNKLCSKLAPNFIHVARQVCSQWLNNVENFVGLKVKIDNSVAGNSEFVQSVKVCEARIVKWQLDSPDELSVRFTDSTAALFQFPNCLKKLTLCGRLPAQWRIQHLLEFSNLSHLVLRGLSLHSNDLTGKPFPEPTLETSSEERLLMYQRYEPPLLLEPIFLKRLKKLEIVMNEFGYPSSLPLSVRLNQPELAMEHEILLQRLFFVVLNNVTFLLNNMICPNLTLAQLYVYHKAGTMTPARINWKNYPLQRFLLNHQSCLKALFLPEFEGKHDNSDAGDLSKFPTQLEKLQAYISKFVGDREEGRQQNTTYWQRFLMEQANLQDVLLSFSDLSTAWLEEALSGLLFASKETLRYIDIAIQSEETTQLNLEMFSFCHGLRVLKIAGRDNETVVKNINKLPYSLVKLYISMALVEPPADPTFIQKFKQLEMVVVKTILVGDHQFSHSRTLAMIQNLFQLRQLNLLMLTFDSPLNSNHGLISMVSRLDEDIDSPYPVFTVKFNLGFEFQEGWNEDTFDEESLDIEYINMREPEDYPTWPNRHRNAISVDDEDHRIFIFQTLPFLLDLRGGRRAIMGRRGRPQGQNEDDDEGIGDDDDDDDDTDSDDSTVTVVNDRSADDM